MTDDISTDSMTDKPVEHLPDGVAAFSCLCQNDLLAATEEERWMDEKVIDTFPPVPFPPAQMYRDVGENTLRRLIERQHERLKESEIGHMFSDPLRLVAAVNKSIAFVLEASGGPATFTSGFGEVRMRGRHFRITINERDRNVWLTALLVAFDDVDFPASWRPAYWRWMEAFSIRMINRRTTMQAPPRFPYQGAELALQQALGLVAIGWSPAVPGQSPL